MHSEFWPDLSVLSNEERKRTAERLRQRYTPTPDDICGCVGVNGVGEGVVCVRPRDHGARGFGTYHGTELDRYLFRGCFWAADYEVQVQCATVVTSGEGGAPNEHLG